MLLNHLSFLNPLPQPLQYNNNLKRLTATQSLFSNVSPFTKRNRRAVVNKTPHNSYLNTFKAISMLMRVGLCAPTAVLLNAF